MCLIIAQIDLSNNSLCGLTAGHFGHISGTYNAEGIKAIASAISVSASLTSINLRANYIGAEGAKHIAEGIAVSASLTRVDLLSNRFDDTTVLMLLDFKKKKTSLLTLCGLELGATAVDFSHCLNLYDVKLLAPEIAVSASLTSINLRGNTVGVKGAKYVSKGIAVSASLTSINLSGNDVGDEGATFIAQGISVSASLRSIDLSDNRLDDEAAKHIAEGISVSASLTCIDLGYNRIGEKGAKHIAKGISDSASLTNVLAFVSNHLLDSLLF